MPTFRIRKFREVAARNIGLPSIVLEASRDMQLHDLGIYYIVRRLANKRKAETAVRSLLDIFQPAECGRRILLQAVNGRFKEFEDAVQYFAALEAEAEIMVTRNTKDFPDDGSIPALTPTEFLATCSFIT